MLTASANSRLPSSDAPAFYAGSSGPHFQTDAPRRADRQPQKSDLGETEPLDFQAVDAEPVAGQAVETEPLEQQSIPAAQAPAHSGTPAADALVAARRDELARKIMRRRELRIRRGKLLQSAVIGLCLTLGFTFVGIITPALAAMCIAISSLVHFVCYKILARQATLATHSPVHRDNQLHSTTSAHPC